MSEKVILINIEDEMRTAYIDYSMSVIVSRALPDARDGLKPVHRRVLFGMSNLGLTYNKAYKKSATIVGEVLGKYHPHGDSSVYDTMVRMAQPWSLRCPLVDGQGNFGSVDGDSPAAMRYTEARLTRLSDELLADIDKDTVDFRPNFDDSLQEPSVLPAKYPNLLVNGASGIAVGMATDILPHNLGEVIDGTIAYIDNEDITIAELMEYIPAPDFPTGGIIHGVEGVRLGFENGLGKVLLRGKADIETDERGRETIIITEIPYQVNKATMVMKIAELVNEKRIEGISDVRDESDRQGMRVVVEVRKDAQGSVVLSQLYKYTQLQSTLRIGNIALVNGRPVTLNLKMMIAEFVRFRLDAIVRRTRFELRKAEERAHILEGLLIALDNLDAVISLIRGSQNAEEAREGLITQFGLSEVQARAILAMRLQALTGLERDKVRGEYDELMKHIAYLNGILDSDPLRRDIIKAELIDIKTRNANPRRTQIEFVEGEISIEDLIPNEEVVITISHLGYIKRTKSSEYKSQNRGGRGSRGAAVREEDYVEYMFIADTHNYLMFFTEQGRCHWLRVYQIPEGTKTSKGRAIQNLLVLAPDDKIKAYIKVTSLSDEHFLDNNFIMFCTKRGQVKKTSLRDYSRPRANGINAITINEGDALLEAKLTNGANEIMLAKRSGLAVRFSETKVREMGRNAAGVRGTEVAATDEVIGMVCIDPKVALVLSDTPIEGVENTTDGNDTDIIVATTTPDAVAPATILVVSSKGMGKRSDLDEYRITNRGGKGVKTLNITEKTGALIAIKSVTDDDDLMITTRNGITIRMQLDALRVTGRATQGVRLIGLQDSDSIADVTVVPRAEEDEFEEA